jgi:preprotein translocase subunit YajC
MFDWFSSQRREQKRKDAHEKELKKSLASKVAHYEKYVDSADDEFTEVAIDGKKVRVAKQQITINGIWSQQTAKSTK